MKRLLTKLNERDAALTTQRLNEIAKHIGSEAEVQQFLFGGSVAKHTYVDGISDVDALAILSRSDLEGRSPEEMLHAFQDILERKLTREEINEVRAGRLAITVTYKDGMEIQILPALRSAGNDEVRISTSTGQGWKTIDPAAFQEQLTSANQRLNGLLVPTIKLVKSALQEISERHDIGGYHVESLCLLASKGYRGELALRALVTHTLESAGRLMLAPIEDVTHQSHNVDARLGPANSPARQAVSNEMSVLSKRLKAATTIEHWKQVLE